MARTEEFLNYAGQWHFLWVVFYAMYLSNPEPLTSVSCPFNAVFHILCGPVPTDAGKLLLLLMQIFNPSIISIAVLENVSPTKGYRKEPLFSHQL
jgi:hypothetical protein